MMQSALLAKYSNSATHIKNPTFYDSIALGSLKSESVVVSVSDEGKESTDGKIVKSFHANDGYLSLSQMFGSYTVSTFTNITLLDNDGNTIASSIYYGKTWRLIITL